MGELFPARESLVSDILAGDRNFANPFFTVYAGEFVIFILSLQGNFLYSY